MFKKIIFNMACLLLLSACMGGGPGMHLEHAEVSGPITLKVEDSEKIIKKMPRFSRLYKIYWSGLHVGNAYTEIIPTQEGYGMRLHMRSRGVAKLLTDWKGNSAASMYERDDKSFVPKRFLTAYENRKKPKRIELLFNKAGSVQKESVEPPDNRDKRPAVPAANKNGVYDPVSLIFAARHEVRKAIEAGKNTFTMKMYDGRRRTDLPFTILGMTEEGLIHISFTEIPVAGYTDREMKGVKDGERQISLYLSRHDLFPVFVKGTSPLGSATIRYSKDCDSVAACMLEEGDV